MPTTPPPYKTMKYLAIAVLLLFTSCATTPEKTASEDYQEQTYQNLARQSLLQLSDSQRTLLDNELDDAFEQAYEQCETIDRNYTIIFAATAAGDIADYWIYGDKAAAACIAKHMATQRFTNPTEETLYFPFNWVSSTFYPAEPYVIKTSDYFNPALRVDFSYREENNVMIAQVNNLRFTHNPDYEPRSHTLSNITLGLQFYSEEEICKEQDLVAHCEEPGWMLPIYGEPQPLNATLTIGEEIKLDGVTLQLDMTDKDIDRSLWVSIVIQIETEPGRWIYARSEPGYLSTP